MFGSDEVVHATAFEMISDGEGCAATVVALPSATAQLPDVLRPTGEWFGNAVVLLFLVAQLLDGVFTYLGVAAFGVREGNPLIEHSMDALGLGPSLTVAKMVAAGGAMVLHLLGFHRLLAVLTLLYLSFAILPWTWVLLTAN